MDSEVLALVVRAKDEASGTFKKLSGELKGFGGAVGGIAGDLGKIGLIAGGAALAGVGALAAGLTMATKAAAEEQVGIDRLNQTLKNNVVGFTGNTKAIDAAIAKREKLAFSDDKLRDSLNALVPRTKDVNEALRLQSLAMDLARAKNMDLETATAIVGKVYGGNTAILTRYGIAVDKNATSTEALASLQAQVAGQADAYAKTTKGSFESFQIAIDDVVEDIGSALLPVATQFAQMITGTLVPAVQDIAGRFQEWVSANQPLLDQVSKFASEVLTKLVTVLMNDVIPGFVELLTRAGEFAAKVVADVGPAIKGLVDKFVSFIPTIIELGRTIQDMATRIWEGGLNKAVGVAIKLIGSIIDVIGGLVQAIVSNNDAMNVLRTAAEMIGAAFGIAADIISGLIDFLGKFADAVRSNKAIMDTLVFVGHAIAAAFGAAATAVGAVIDALKTAIGLAGDAIKTIGGLPGINLIFGGGKAAGGPVVGGNAYLVGERGPELFVPPGSGGNIVPNGALGGVSVNVNLSGAAVFDPYGTAAQQVATALLPGLRRALTASGMSLA